ncbi:MAG: heavy metal translocating P-type ATPase, partial [Oscillospiraceae bacterium]|nr:heavy metal translocating P-type ATPase [Oscillospiraceae bacterium]
MEKTYDIKNLECAHCGGKIEAAIAGFDEVESAVLNFPLRKIKISGNITPELERKMNHAAGKIEADVKIVPESGEKAESSGLKREIITLAAGAVIYAGAIILHSILKLDIPSVVLFIAAYLLLGYEILTATVKNVSRGNIFDENFLMTIATVGAFILGDYSEAVGVVLFFKIGEIFEDYAVNKSRKAITAAAGLKVDEAELLTEDGFVITSSQNIKVGDIIRVKPGERIAADGVVESGETRIDTSAVNGEPVPVSVRKGEKVISGCINISEAITVRATAAAGDSMISKIADAVENASASKPKIDRFISRFAKVYTPVVIAIAAFTAIVPSIITGEWQKWIYTALTFLVISCPCALVLSVPLAYFAGIGAASRLGILFKGGSSLEALGRVKAFAFDKTGTVTNGTFTVTDIKNYSGISQQEFLSLCGAAETASTHPVAESIVNYCKENSVNLPQPERVSEYSGRGIVAEVGGKTVLCGNERLLREKGINFADTGEKISGSVVYGAWDGIVQGRIVVSDTIKSRSAEAVKNLRAMGMYTAMLTGDKEENAEITGEKLGIDSVRGGLMPEDKLAEIRKIREEHGAVMFVGDGINDGPVLAGADVGGAMHTGADLALEAADAVFMNPELDSVVRAKKIADRTLRISWENIIFALLIKAAVLAIGLLGHPSMWFAVFADSGT